MCRCFGCGLKNENILVAGSKMGALCQQRWMGFNVMVRTRCQQRWMGLILECKDEGSLCGGVGGVEEGCE